ncbi:MAG: class I SAM-dependent methyltransferase [Chlorobi bacterium]|nr:class I SAM-dependent methyltransferase [Chlorobiota bacterium]
MALSKEEIKKLYRKRAPNYNITANLYYLIGFREKKYRELSAAALNVKKGDAVLEIGCGTGLNFPILLEKVGKEGKIIGIDLTDKMLEQAGVRVLNNNWKNIDLINIDAVEYEFGERIDAVISTFAFTMIPEYERVLRNISLALKPGSRFVICDFKKPEQYPDWITKLGVFITKPFGVSIDLAERKPWLKMKQYYSKVEVKEIYGGFAYIAVGIA